MFNNALIDVAIGLIATYLILSLVASAAAELLEPLLRTRAKYLWQGIGELLDDPPLTRRRWRITEAERKGRDHKPPKTEAPSAPRIEEKFNGKRRSKSGHRSRGRAQRRERTPSVAARVVASDRANDTARRSITFGVADVYQHPIVNGLFYGNYNDAKGRLLNRTLPGYIPPRAFAMAVIDRVSSNAPPGLSAIESFRRGIEALENQQLKGALRAAAKLSGDDMVAVQRSIEAWYDAAMNRVSGWYKRHTQVVLLMIGIGLAAALNVDSIDLARSLATDQAKRNAYVAAASNVNAWQGANTALPPEDRIGKYVAEIDKLRTPIGATDKRTPHDGYLFLAGWIITAIAVSFGAPFWFDLLSKFMIVRATVKPADRSTGETTSATSQKPQVFLMTGS